MCSYGNCHAPVIAEAQSHRYCVSPPRHWPLCQRHLDMMLKEGIAFDVRALAARGEVTT